MAIVTWFNLGQYINNVFEIEKVKTTGYNIASGYNYIWLNNLRQTIINGKYYFTSFLNLSADKDTMLNAFSYPGNDTMYKVFTQENNSIIVPSSDKKPTVNTFNYSRNATGWVFEDYKVNGNSLNKSVSGDFNVTERSQCYLIFLGVPTFGDFPESYGWCYYGPSDGNSNIYSATAFVASRNFWESGILAPFGNTTPTGTIGGYGTYDDTSDSIPVPDNFIDDIYANAFGGNGMHLYGVSGEGLKNFLSKVYTTDFWQYWANTMFNPMEGIISCLYLPINYGLINGANTNSVHVSNAELQTGEGKVKILYNYTYDTSTGVLPVEEYFGSFLDYAPYTSAELYLPFYGTVPINIDSIMGGSIKVQYRINLVTGTFSVFVICVDRFGVQTILQYAGSCGMSIPIVSGNNGAQNRITDLVQGIANVALGNYVGAGMNAVNALTEKGYVYTNSKISGSAGYDGVKDVFLTITRPVLSNPEKYSEIKQRPADMFVKLSELSGEYSIEKQNLDIHDKNITDEEIAEIENILQGGAIF